MQNGESNIALIMLINSALGALAICFQLFLSVYNNNKRKITPHVQHVENPLNTMRHWLTEACARSASATDLVFDAPYDSDIIEVDG